MRNYLSRLKSLFSHLGFQILAPSMICVLLIAFLYTYFAWVATNRFSKLQKEMSANNLATTSLLQVARIRGETKANVLLYRMTRDSKYETALAKLEAERRAHSRSLQAQVHSMNPDIILLESFFSGGAETLELRRRILEAIKSGEAERADRLYANYSMLFEINTARLSDLHAFLRARLAKAELQVRGLLQQAVVAVMALLALVSISLIAITRFYRRRLLNPLGVLHSGLRDVTAGKLETELPIQPASVEIEDMLRGFNSMTGALTRQHGDLQAAREEALKAANVKSEFLSNMSHEIRTPLNVIAGTADLIAENPGAAEPKQFEVLKNSSRILLNTVNDILDYSRFEFGQVILAEDVFEIRHVIHEVADILRPSAAAKGLALEVQLQNLPERIVGDRHRLEQLILNLVNNAVKFTDHGRISIEAESKSECLSISVRDTGIGIPSETLPRIFSRFEQGDAVLTKGRSGTGLGLAIVKQILTLMNGQIQVDSAPGKGSCFTIELPLRVAAETFSGSNSVQKRSSDTNSVDLRNLKVLLVDDSYENRYLIKKYFEGTGAEIVEKVNGLEAVHAVEQTAFDLILMDIQMPEMDGYEATREIRRRERDTFRARTPIIALTAFALEQEVQKCLHSGCDSHLAKPVMKRDLLGRVRELRNEV